MSTVIAPAATATAPAVTGAANNIVRFSSRAATALRPVGSATVLGIATTPAAGAWVGNVLRGGLLFTVAASDFLSPRAAGGGFDTIQNQTFQAAQGLMAGGVSQHLRQITGVAHQPAVQQLRQSLVQISQRYPGQQFQLVRVPTASGLMLAFQSAVIRIPLMVGAQVISNPLDNRVNLRAEPSVNEGSTATTRARSSEHERAAKLEAAQARARQMQTRHQGTVNAAWRGSVLKDLRAAYGSIQGQFELATRPQVQLRGTNSTSAEAPGQAISRAYEAAAKHAFGYNQQAASAARMVAFRHPNNAANAPVLVFTGAAQSILRLVNDGVISATELAQAGLSTQGLMQIEAKQGGGGSGNSTRHERQKSMRRPSSGSDGSGPGVAGGGGRNLPPGTKKQTAEEPPPDNDGEVGGSFGSVRQRESWTRRPTVAAPAAVRSPTDMFGPGWNWVAQGLQSFSNHVPIPQRVIGGTAVGMLVGGLGMKIFTAAAWRMGAPDKISQASSNALTLESQEFRPQIDSRGQLVVPDLLKHEDLYKAALEEELSAGLNSKQATDLKEKIANPTSTNELDRATQNALNKYHQLMEAFRKKIANPNGDMVRFDRETWQRLYKGATRLQRTQQEKSSITVEDLAKREPQYFRGNRDQLVLAMKRHWVNQAYLVGMVMDRSTQVNLDVAVDLTKDKIANSLISLGESPVSANDLTHSSFWGRTQPAGVQAAQVAALANNDLSVLRDFFALAELQDIEKTVVAVKTQYNAVGGAHTASASQRLAYIQALKDAIRNMEGLIEKLEQWNSPRALAEARKYKNELNRELQLVADRAEGLDNQGQALATQIRQLSTQQDSVRTGVASLVSNAVRNLNEEANNNGLGLTNEGVILLGGAKLRAPVRDEGESSQEYRNRIRPHCQNAGRAIAKALISKNETINGMRDEVSIAKYLEDSMVAITDSLEKRAAGTDLLRGGSQVQENPPPTTRRPDPIRPPANGAYSEEDTLIPTPANPATPEAGGLMP